MRRKKRSLKEIRANIARLEKELGLDDGVADLSEDADREQQLQEMRAKRFAKKEDWLTDSPLLKLRRKWDRDANGGLLAGEPMQVNTIVSSASTWAFSGTDWAPLWPVTDHDDVRPAPPNVVMFGGAPPAAEPEKRIILP